MSYLKTPSSLSLGKYLMGIPLVILGTILFGIPAALFPQYSQTSQPSNMGLLLLLLPFLGGALGLYVAGLLIGIPFKRLISIRHRMDWKRFFVGFAFWGGLTLILGVVELFFDRDLYEWNFNLSTFSGLLLIAVLLIPVQASFEELFFRGYLMQMIACVTRFKWLPPLLSTVLFGLMHIANPEVQALGYVALFPYMLMGAFFAIVTLLDGGLELSMGMHSANNLFIALMVSSDKLAVHTNALFLYHGDLPNVAYQLLITLFLILISLLFLRNRYKW